MLRKFSYIYNSRVDFVDLWINLTMIVLGLHSIFFDPIDIQPYYKYLSSRGITSDEVGYVCVVSGLLNTVRLILPFHLKLSLCVLLKSLTLFMMSLLLFSVINYNLVSPVIVFYFMMSLLCLDNFMRTS